MLGTSAIARLPSVCERGGAMEVQWRCNGGAMEVQWRDICCRIRHVLMREEAEAEEEGGGLWEEEGCTEEYTT